MITWLRKTDIKRSSEALCPVHREGHHRKLRRAACRGRSHNSQRRIGRFFVSGSRWRPHRRLSDVRIARHHTGVAVRPQPLREPRFVLDVHLGKLAAYLRMLGFDTAYRNCFTDDELVKVSAKQHRILLTRDRGVLKHSVVTHGYWLRETDSRRQAEEIIRRFDLLRAIQPFTRCMACNGVLEPVSKDQVREQLPPRTAELYDEFRQCPQCGRLYWKGSHYTRMQRWIEALPQAQQTPP